MPLRKTHDPSNIDAPQVSNNESTTNIDGSRRKSWGQRSLNLLEWSFTSLASGGRVVVARGRAVLGVGVAAKVIVWLLLRPQRRWQGVFTIKEIAGEVEAGGAILLAVDIKEVGAAMVMA